ncbi:MAG TPA: hypothetical protein VN496_08885 [Burkholderiales bacterium]|nr:hypothetical protein [Burkholderiales bacterium]
MTAVAAACYDSHVVAKVSCTIRAPQCAAIEGDAIMSMLDIALVAGVLLLAVLIVARKKR